MWVRVPEGGVGAPGCRLVAHIIGAPQCAGRPLYRRYRLNDWVLLCACVSAHALRSACAGRACTNAVHHGPSRPRLRHARKALR